MEKDTVKIIICIAIFLVFGGLTALLMLRDINLGFAEFSSIDGVIAKKEELVRLEGELNVAEQNYALRKIQLEGSKAEFNKAKAKYESISDKTIDLIKEATTEENYDIEYMWIKLGNYALVNNLSIVMVEPGGTNSVINNGVVTTTKPNTTANNTTTTTQTSTNQTTTTTTNGTNNTNNGGAVSNENPSSQVTTSTTDDSILTVTVQGSYLNMSDFVFEVENDKELRFKLDNIEITCVTGTTIKAKFNVKNVIILK